VVEATTTMTRLAAVITVSAATVLAACNGGGSAGPATDPPNTSRATPSTSTSTTSSSSTSTTIAEPTTTVFDEEALKAEIAADYEENYFELRDLFLRPSLDDLDNRLAEVAQPGSESDSRLTARLEELIELGDALVPNDPDLFSVSVESVELVGAAPYVEAVVTACQVDNRKQVTLAENSPAGVEVLVSGSDRLRVGRYRESVKLTAFGWVSYTGRLDGESFDGVETCPSA
jgi:hypothetical protein